MTCPSKPGSVWLQSKLAYEAAEAIYRAVMRDEHVKLSAAHFRQQQEYITGVEAMIREREREQRTEPCNHFWARRRDGRRCAFCGVSEFGAQSPFRDEHGVMLEREEKRDDAQ